jgi:AraC-like DNA-binding protein
MECFAGALAFRSMRRFHPGQKLIEVRLTGPEDGRREAASRYYDCPVQFGCLEHALIFDARLLDETYIGLGPANHLREWAIEQRRELEQSDPLASLERRYRQAVANGCGHPQSVADHLGISIHELRHQIRQSGSAHRELLDDARRWVSMRLLLTEDTSVDAIAKIVGFANKRVLHRSLQRWLGITPGEFRKVYAFHNAWWLAAV